MKYKTKVTEPGFTKDNVIQELDSLIAEYTEEYGEEPTQILVDNFTVWDLIGAGVSAADDGKYRGKRITVTILTDHAQILVTDDEGIEDITTLLKESVE